MFGRKPIVQWPLSVIRPEGFDKTKRVLGEQNGVGVEIKEWTAVDPEAHAALSLSAYRRKLIRIGSPLVQHNGSCRVEYGSVYALTVRQYTTTRATGLLCEAAQSYLRIYSRIQQVGVNSRQSLGHLGKMTTVLENLSSFQIQISLKRNVSRCTSISNIILKVSLCKVFQFENN